MKYLATILNTVTGELVGKASAATLAKNSCTVSVLHLREAVAKEKTFDFLQVNWLPISSFVVEAKRASRMSSANLFPPTRRKTK